MQPVQITIVRSVFAFCLLLPFANTVAAEAPADSANFRRNLVSFRVPDAIFKSFFFNYERLLAPQHGLVLEGGYIGPYGINFTISENSARWQVAHGYTLSVQYRYHFWQGFDAFFLGVFFKYGSLSGTIRSSDGPGVLFSTTTGQPSIGFASLYQIVGINIGRSFILGPGIAVTVRIGTGATFGYEKYSTNDFEKNRDAFEAIFHNFLRFDLEASVGYAF